MFLKMDTSCWTRILLLMLCFIQKCLSLPNEIGSEYVCYARPADVFFLLDSSNSIWRPDFETQLHFVNDVIEFFPIGDEYIRVGVITFESFPRMIFNLDRFERKEDIREAVYSIQQHGGLYTHTDRALNMMRVNFMNFGRPNAIKIGIVITDGLSTSTDLTYMQAMYARATGVNLFAIGIGKNFDSSELYNIANMPDDDFMFLVENYASLDSIKQILAVRTCQVTAPPTTTTTTTTTTTAPTTTTTTTTTTPLPVVVVDTQKPSLVPVPVTPPQSEVKGKEKIIFENGCIPKQPLDLAFIIDDKKGGSANKGHILEMIRNIISHMKYNEGDVRINIIRECAEVPEMKMSQFYDKNSILDHLDRTRPILERTPGLLRAATNKLNESSDIWTNSVLNEDEDMHKVAVYITNGESRDLEGTLREAQYAKSDSNIEIFGVGIGDEVNMVELNGIVSCDPKDHLHTVGKHSDLQKIYRDIANKLCLATAS